MDKEYQHPHVAWKVGDPDSTRKVSEQTGVSVERLNEMAANFMKRKSLFAPKTGDKT